MAVLLAQRQPIMVVVEGVLELLVLMEHQDLDMAVMG
jgi:hypothetical protein